MKRPVKTIGTALYELFEDSGFSMAGAVAFSFVLSLFPFCIFLGALAGTLGGAELAAAAVHQLFNVAPKPVAEALAPEVEAVMGQSRFGLVTLGAIIALFFATSAIESLRAALNVAYRVRETRTYFYCLAQSALFVFVSAIGMLAIAWGVVVGPAWAAKLKPVSLLWLVENGWMPYVTRYGIVILLTGAQLVAYHLWLAAGKRRLSDVWPGVVLSIALWVFAAGVYSSYLSVNDYSRFYAGLTQLMSALIFFQVTAMIVILGAELNRGIAEMRQKLASGEVVLGAAPTALRDVERD
jgi:membrane protein